MFSPPVTVEAVTALLNDTAGFVAWIKTHRYTETIGYAGSEYQCPIARYLRAMTGYPLWVTPDRVSLNTEDTLSVTMPLGLGDFAHQIDGHGQYNGQLVTRRRAQAVLKRLGWEG
jgi:hypothetical protein